MADESSDVQELVRRIAAGDQQALAEAFTRYRGRLRRMVLLRLDRRLQGRIAVGPAIGMCMGHRGTPTQGAGWWSE